MRAVTWHRRSDYSIIKNIKIHYKGGPHVMGTTPSSSVPPIFSTSASLSLSSPEFICASCCFLPSAAPPCLPLALIVFYCGPPLGAPPPPFAGGCSHWPHVRLEAPPRRPMFRRGPPEEALCLGNPFALLSFSSFFLPNFRVDTAVLRPIRSHRRSVAFPTGSSCEISTRYRPIEWIGQAKRTLY